MKTVPQLGEWLNLSTFDWPLQGGILGVLCTQSEIQTLYQRQRTVYVPAPNWSLSTTSPAILLVHLALATLLVFPFLKHTKPFPVEGLSFAGAVTSV